jgi:predicted nucleic acid-binding protein
MHKVISNTTPIISLLKINKLYLLNELVFKGTWISPRMINKILELAREK